MNKEQMRARLQEIHARLAILAGMENMEQAELEELTGLNTEFEGVSAKLEALEDAEANMAKATKSTRKTVAAQPAQTLQVGASQKEKKFGGFDSTGDFLMAVKNASSGQIHKNFQNTMYEKNAEDGGFLVPEEMQSAIVTKLESDESLWSKVNDMNIGGNNLTLNVDEAQPWNSGVQAYWTSEGAPITESQGKFKQVSFRLQKLAALVKATDELLDDTVALESYIKKSAPNAIMHKLNDTIIGGDGVGKPEGILQSGFTISVAKEVGQAADSIVPANIIKMYSRMFPQALSNSVWFINAGAAEELRGMKNANNEYIYLTPGSQMNSSPYALLMGRPVIPMMSAMKALGDSGDILFANLDYYYGIQKASIKQAESIHLHFDREITAFRFTKRVDGKVPFQTPVTTQYGNYGMSAFVKLNDRA